MTPFQTSDFHPSMSDSDKWKVAALLGGSLFTIIALGIFNQKVWAKEWTEIEPDLRATIETVAAHGPQDMKIDSIPVGPSGTPVDKMVVAQLEERFALACSKVSDRKPLLYMAPRGVPQGTPLRHKVDASTMKAACAKILASA